MIGAGCIILIVAIIVSTVLDGLVLVQLWKWFIVPSFNLPVLTLPIAIGIDLIVSLVTVTNTGKVTDSDFLESATKSLMWVIAKPITYGIIGWIVFQLAGL